MASKDIELFVPGRVCLFGEHTDWSGSFRRFNSALQPGKTLVVGTNAGLYARVRSHPSSLVVSTVDDKGVRHGPVEIPMTPKALLAVAVEGGFFSYAAGVAYQILTDYRVSGLVIDNYKCDLPLKKGLSSSAAICVLVARAFNRVYSLNMTTRGEMEYAYKGELVTPSRCGRMDQACAFGSRPVLMTYDGEFVDTATISVTKPLHLVIVDLCAKKDTVEILAKLQGCFPFAKNEDEGNVQKLLGPINQSIMARAIAAVEAGDPETLGKLMTEAQAHFDEYAGKVCPSQLTAPVLHKVLGHEALKPHVYGGKGVGAGGDGTAQFLCKTEADQAVVAAILERDFGMPSLFLTVAASQPVRKAVIPAAGFGGGLFPASKVCKPELFPIIDATGVAKPAILLNVEELLAAGMEEVHIIVQPEDLPVFSRLFHEKLAPQNYHKLGATGKAYEDELMEIGRSVKFIVQEKQEGFGHAVWCAKEAMAGQPFMLVLGDHIYRSSTKDASCATQLLQYYLRAGTSVLGLKRSPAADVSQFGCVAGSWLDHDDASDLGRRAVAVSELAEKPSIEYARDKLAMPAMPVDEYLTAFGMYVINPAIFDVLDEMIAHNIRSDKAGFEFSTALERLRQKEGLHGYVISGQRFDLGSPEHYFESLAALHAPLRSRHGSVASGTAPLAARAGAAAAVGATASGGAGTAPTA